MKRLNMIHRIKWKASLLSSKNKVGNSRERQDSARPSISETCHQSNCKSIERNFKSCGIENYASSKSRLMESAKERGWRRGARSVKGYFPLHRLLLAHTTLPIQLW